MILRRVLLLVAVLLAMTAIAVAVAPPSSVTDPPAPVRTPEPQAASPGTGRDEGDAPAEGDPGPPDVPVRTLRADRAGQVIRVADGDRLLLRVRSEDLESVQLGTDGPIETTDPDSPAEFEVFVDGTLEADVRLLESGRTIGRVTTEQG